MGPDTIRFEGEGIDVDTLATLRDKFMKETYYHGDWITVTRWLSLKDYLAQIVSWEPSPMTYQEIYEVYIGLDLVTFKKVEHA